MNIEIEKQLKEDAPKGASSDQSGWLDLASGVFTLVWGALGCYGLYLRPNLFADDHGLDPGPGLMPAIVITIITSGGFLLAIRGAWLIVSGAGGDWHKSLLGEFAAIRIGILLFLSTLGYAVLLKSVGFALLTPVLAAPWIAIIAIRDGAPASPKTAFFAVLSSILLTAVIYLVFRRLIGVPLP
jgi:hypothetical protein